MHDDKQYAAEQLLGAWGDLEYTHSSLQRALERKQNRARGQLTLLLEQARDAATRYVKVLERIEAARREK